jgi:hypothetical protein
MATDEEVYKFIIQVENEEKLKTVAAAASLAEQKFKALHDQLGAGHAQTKAAAAGVVDLNRQLATGASRKRDFGRAALEASRGLEDLQYGVSGVLNNIPSLIQSLGGPAGLAAGVSIAAVAGKILYDHWNDLTRLFGEGHTKTAAEEMEELRKKTSLTADEAERLARADNLKGKVGELRAAKTDEQKAEEAAATHAIAQAGFANVVQGIKQTAPEFIETQGDAAKASEIVKKLEAELASVKAHGSEDPNAIPRAEQAVNDAKIDLAKAIDKTAGDIAAAGTLPAEWAGQRQKIADLAAKNPAAFAGGDARRGRKFVEAMNEAGKSPEDLAIDKKNREFDAQAAKQMSEKRLAGIKKEADEAENERKKGEDAYNKRRDELIRDSSRGMREAYTPELLNNVARGKTNDPAALAKSVSDRLVKGGMDAAKAQDIAPNIAQKLLEDIGLRVGERANQEGLTKEEAAAREAGDDAASARARAPKPHGSISGLTEFASNLQMSLFNKQDPIQVEIRDLNRRQADFQEKLYEETKKARGQNKPAVAVAAGPA